jgi:hypothetical protein
MQIKTTEPHPYNILSKRQKYQIFPKEINILFMFIAALFTIARIQNQYKCLLMDE